jgi:integrase/recombinase XerD
MAATSSLNSLLRAATYQTLIGLLARTGMRVGEAIAPDRPDFDPGAGVLTVRDSKFGKSRLVPLHPTVTAALSGYLRLRDRLHPGPSDPAVFISPAGTRLAYCNVHATWRLLVRRAGLRPRSPNCRPRPHDLRHYADSWVMRPAVTFPLAGVVELVLRSA